MSGSAADRQRRILARTLRQIGNDWHRSFKDEQLGSTHYYDLFTEIWLREGERVCKTDCYRFMPGLSRQTAKKYVVRAIALGYLIERNNPADRRSKLITLSADAKALVEANFDKTAKNLRNALGRPGRSDGLPSTD